MRGATHIDDALEPLDPESGEPLALPQSRLGRGQAGGPGSARPRPLRQRDRPSPLSVVRPRNPRAMRLWLLAVSLGALSLLNFVGAGYLKSVEADLRDLEAVWSGVVAVDADRERADRAILQTALAFGNSPGLDDKRDTLYDAADARFTKFQRDLRAVDPNADGVKDLRDDMLRAIVQRRSDFKEERVARADDALLTGLDRRLDDLLDRWRVDPREVDVTRLTTAYELTERLERPADETTSLVIGAISRSGLHVVDVDQGTVATRTLELSSTATVHPMKDRFAVVDNGIATAFSATSSTPPLWTRPAEAAVSAGDGETMWVQQGSSLLRIDASSIVVATEEAPAGARLASVTDDGSPVLMPSMVTRTGARRGDGAYGINATHAAVLWDSGQVVVARHDGWERRPLWDALRLDLPRLIDLTALP